MEEEGEFVRTWWVKEGICGLTEKGSLPANIPGWGGYLKGVCWGWTTLGTECAVCGNGGVDCSGTHEGDFWNLFGLPCLKCQILSD